MSEELYNNKNYSNSQDILGVLCFVIFAPFITFIVALFNLKHKWAKIVVVLFFGLFGAAMVAPDEGIDLSRYLFFLKSFETIPWSGFFDMLRGKYVTNLGETGGVDFYRDMVAFFVSRVSSSSNILMLVYGLVYGYFVVKALSALSSGYSNIPIKAIILIFCIFEVLGFRSLGGVRYCTAIAMLLYGAIILYKNADKRGMFIAICSCFIHFAVLLPSIIMITAAYVTKKRSLLLLLLLISFILPILNIDIASSYFGLLQNTVYSDRVELYTSDIVIENRLENVATVWYVRYRIEPILYFSLFSLLSIWFKKNKIIESDASIKLWCLSVMCLIFANLFFNTPSLFERMRMCFLVFWVSYMFLLYKENSMSITINRLVIGTIMSFALIVLYEFRSIMYITSPWLYFGTSINVLLNDSSTSIYMILFG